MGDSCPFFRLRILIRHAFSNLCSHLSQTFGLLRCPVLLFAALLLNEQPTLLTLLLGAAWDACRNLLPVGLRELVSVFLVLVKL